MQKRVLVVDDHPVFRAGLIGIIKLEPGLMVCGEAANAAQALAAVERLNPDLVLLDMGLPDQDGLELLKHIRQLQPRLPVLTISMHDESLFAERVLRAGGRGYLMKQEGPEQILQAIHKVLAGQIVVSEHIAALIFDNLSSARPKSAGAPLAKLTDREFEVLQLIARGKDSRSIADHLGLSIKTVDTHRAHVRAKLKLRNNTELVHYAANWIHSQPWQDHAASSAS